MTGSPPPESASLTGASELAEAQRQWIARRKQARRAGRGRFVFTVGLPDGVTEAAAREVCAVALSHLAGGAR